MKLWLISQEENTNYDTFDSAVVRANTEQEAKGIHPGSDSLWRECWRGTWADSPEKVTAKHIGESIEDTPGVVLASFNAG